MLALLSRQSVLMVSPPLPMRTPGRRAAGASNPGGMIGFPCFFTMAKFTMRIDAWCFLYNFPGRSLDDPDGAGMS